MIFIFYILFLSLIPQYLNEMMKQIFSSNIIESFSDKNHYPNNKIVRQKHRTRVYLGNDMLTTKDIITDDNDTNGPATGPQPHVTHSDIDKTNDEASDSKTDDPIYANLPNISSGDSFDSSGSDKPKLVGILKSPGDTE